MALMNRFALLVSTLSLAAFLGVSQAAPSLKEGKYKGSCVVVASAPTGITATCNDKGAVTALPFYAEVAYNLTSYKYQYKYSFEQVKITSNNGKENGYVGFVGKWVDLALKPIPKSKALCATAYLPNDKTKKLRILTEKIGSNGIWQFVEEGQIWTGNNTFFDKACPTSDTPKLYCNPTSYNYRCVAYLY